MGYKTPNVVKEIYLPVPMEQISFDEYKAKYGINLNDLFYDSNDVETLKPAKYYLDDCESALNIQGSDFVARHGIYPVSVIYISANNTLIFGINPQILSGESITLSYQGIIIELDEKTISTQVL